MHGLQKDAMFICYCRENVWNSLSDRMLAAGFSLSSAPKCGLR